MFGRYRLPNQELEDPNFAGQLRNLQNCFGSHFYFRHYLSQKFDRKQDDIRIVVDRSQSGIHGQSAFLSIRTPHTTVFVTPRSYWLRHEHDISHGNVTSIGINVLCITDNVRYPRDDDEVLDVTWYYATKRGERDFRYKNNWQVYEVQRYILELAFGDYRWAIMAYSEDNAYLLANSFSAISKQGPVLTFDDDADEPKHASDEEEEAAETYEAPAQAAAPPPTWYEVLAVSPDASAAEIKKAHRERIMQYHPDRVAHLGEKLRVLAEQEAAAINDAYAQAMSVRR